jgi:P27 family predicted phage terminase small subunit
VGRRGPPKRPTALRVLEGNPAHRPLPVNEPRPRPLAPACPAWLSLEAKREWKKVAPELHRMGVLTVVDGSVLAGYCEALAAFQRAVEELRAKGSTTFNTPSGYKQQRPEVGMRNSAMMLVLRFAQELGLTPAARARLEGIDRGGDPERAPGGIR